MTHSDNPRDTRKLVLSRNELAGNNPEVAERSLVATDQKIAGGGLLTGLLLPNQQRAVRRQLAEIEAEVITRMATEQIEACGKQRLQSIELQCERQCTAVRAARNETIGKLMAQTQALAADALQQQIQAESQLQAMIARSNCDEQDRQMLADLNKSIAHHSLRQIASEHNGLPMPVAEADDDQQDA